MLNETKLNSKHKLTFEKYIIIRNKRYNARQRGGTAILINEDIKYKIVDIENKHDLNINECILKLVISC